MSSNYHRSPLFLKHQRDHFRKKREQVGMKLITCEDCGAPIGLRSRGVADAFTPQAIKLRRKYSGKLKLHSPDFNDLCFDCYEKRLRKKKES